MSILDQIKGARQQIAETKAAYTRPYKFKPGKTVISILPLHSQLEKPPSEQVFWRKYGQHFIKNSKGETVVVIGDRSIVNEGEVCPVREGLVDMIRYGNEIGDTKLAESAKESLGKPGYLMNIMVHQDPDGKKEENPVMACLSETNFDNLGSILEEYLAASADDVTRFNDRLMFVVERTGSGKNDTRYSFIPHPRRMTVDKSVMNKATNLDDYVTANLNASQAKALTYISTVLGRPVNGTAFAKALTGASPAPAQIASAGTTASDAEDLLDEIPGSTPAGALDKTRAVDAEFTETPAATATTSADAEDLLAEIDNLAA